MNISFRSYMKSRPIIIEGLRTSFARMRLPVTEGMANLLSLIRGQGTRTRALSWLTTEGLYQASENRQRLFKLVKDQLAGSGILRGGRVSNVPSSKKVAGIHEMAQDVTYSEDPNEISPLDLFSREGLNRFPALAQVSIDGMGIEDYWFKHFEPKEMRIYVRDNRGSQRFSLKEMNDYLVNELKVSPFYYGGHNGYLQYVEKGDWLPLGQQRHGSPNKQFGPDMRPIMDKNGNPVGREFDASTGKPIPIYRFMGGSTRRSHDLKDMEKVISGLEYKMSKLAEEPGNDSLKNLIGSFLKQYEIETGRKGAAKRLFGKSFERGTYDLMAPGHPDYEEKYEAGFDPNKMVSRDFDIQEFINRVWVGMDEPVGPFGLAYFKHPERFGPVWDGTGTPPENGWHRIIGKNERHCRSCDAINPRDAVACLSCGKKFAKTKGLEPKSLFIAVPNDDMKKNIINHITAKWPWYITVRANWNTADPELGAGRNNFWVASAFINNASKTYPDLDNISTVYAYDSDSPGFAQQSIHSDEEEIEVNPKPIDNEPINTRDPLLKSLWDSGYRWKGEEPNWAEKGKVPTGDQPTIKKFYLQLGNDHLEIRRKTFADGSTKWYAMMPSDELAQIDTNSDVKSRTWLAGNVLMDPDLKTRDIDLHPGTESDYNKLIDDLMMGKYGEPLNTPIYNPLTLPSVVDSVTMAKSRYNKKMREINRGKTSDNFETDDLKSLALQGIQARSGDSVLKWGFVTNRDFAERKWTTRENGIYGILTQNVDTFDEEKIKATKEAADNVTNIINQMIENGESWDKFVRKGVQHSVLKAVKKNAFESRKYVISDFIYRSMMRDTNDQMKQNAISASALGKEDDEGNEQKFQAGAWDQNLMAAQQTSGEEGSKYNKTYGRTSSQINRSGEYVDDPTTWRSMSPNDIRRVAGLSELPAEPSNILPMPPKTPTQKRVTQRSVPIQDDIPNWSKIDDQEDLPDWGKFSENYPDIWEDIAKYWKETWAVYDGTKPKDGCGFNWWGAVGHPLGVSIEGDVRKKNRRDRRKKK